jgi:hypothetical protein
MEGQTPIGALLIALSSFFFSYNLLYSHWMEVSKTHTWWGEVFGVICWVWVFHRARHDLPVVLGWKHPWDHDHDDIFTEHVHLNTKALEKDWDESWADPGDVDDEEEDEDDEGKSLDTVRSVRTRTEDFLELAHNTISG